MKKFLFILASAILSLGVSAYAQTINVKGVITDATNGESVPAASVLIKGTTTGVVADFDGNFSISAPTNATLVISSIGFVSQEVPVGGRSTLNISLAPDSELLEDVLVVAYGTAKKSSYSGSAAMVRSDELIKTPVSSVEQALQGKVAGLQITTASGQPGASTSFRIRGAGSLNASNEPLYVIDGVATTSADYSQLAYDAHSTSSIISSINPQDIESITVLKDAAAASLYGSRAANGVVIITTKSGQKGSGKINFSAQAGISEVPRNYELMHSGDYYAKIFNSYLAQGNDVATANQLAQGLITWNPFNNPQPMDASGNIVPGASVVVDTDWQDLVFKRGSTQDYNLSFSGGNDNTTYFVSGGYFDQDGSTPAAHFSRYSGKVTVDSQVKPWFKAGGNAIFSYSLQNTEMSSSAGASPMYNALQFPNGVPAYIVDGNGKYILDANGERQYNWMNGVSKDVNPLALPLMNIRDTDTYRVFASLYAEIEFMKGLTLKTVFSPDYVSLYETLYWNKYHGDGPAYNGRGQKYQTHDLMYTSTTTLNFNRQFNDVHNLSAMLGYEFWQSNRDYFNGTKSNYAFDFMTELAGASNLQELNSYSTFAALKSYIAHAEYNYAEKYFASASFRRDGSSVFGADNKWGNFFSVGASWRISEEDFMQDIDWISSLKLRTSYGTSGNNAGLDRYQSLGLWVSDAEFQYGNNSGLGHTQMSNPELGWEKQKMFNVGLDFGLFNEKITGSIEYFNKKSDDLLYNMPLPATIGVGSVWDVGVFLMMNAAKTMNQGVELALNADVISTKDFNWNLGFNFSYNADKILDLAGDDDIPLADTKKIWKVGHSQYEFYMPTWAGVDAKTGDPLWKSGNTVTNDYNSADYDMQGRATPWGFGSLTNNFSWKGFDFSFMFYYNLGGKVYDSLYATIMHDGNDSGKNLHVDALNAWTPTNTNTDVPIYKNGNDNQSNSPSTRFLYDATYLKLKNVSLSYTLPKSALMWSKGVLSNVRVFANAENLFTVFKDKGYKGYDDIDIFGVGGYDAYANYIPLSRAYTFGVNITF